jgi:hypothetical protein
MAPWRTYLATITLALLCWTVSPPAAQSCPFCSAERGPTLVGDFALASLVLYGHPENNRLNSNGDFVTDFVIEKVIKPHDVIKGKSVLTLRRNIPATKSKFVLFCDVLKGGVIDDYRGVEVTPGSDMVKYLQGAVSLKDKMPGDRLRYAFDFLNDPEFEVAIDAYREFAKADYKDYATMAKTLPADVIGKWLSDPKTPAFRYGLYASLLGHCGSPQHAKLLRSMVDESIKRKTSDIDGLLAGYLMLQPKEAWPFLTNILGDPKNDFGSRYACLRTISFLWEQRPDLVDRKDLTAGLVIVLDQGEMADFGVDYLRKYKCWETTNQVLDLFGKKNFDIPIIKRSILRFALRSPDARAAAFVQQQRNRDPEWVKDIDELLKQERQ